MIKGHEENRETQAYLGSQLNQLRQMVQNHGQQHHDVVELAVNQIMEDVAQAPADQDMEQEVPEHEQPAEVHQVQEPLPAEFIQINCEQIQF